MILVYFIILSFLVSDDKENKKVPTFNLLEDKLDLKIEVKSDIVPDNPNIELLKAQIDEIKERAKNFVPKPVSDTDIIIIKTSHGTMKLKFYPNKAPSHCYNFKKLANSGYYDKTIFHRVIPGFMIQGGDILSRDDSPDNDGTGGPGWMIDQEFNDIRHERGILSMARSRDVNSAGSQFFICVDQAYHLDLKYTAFGKLVDGDEVLDIITNIPSEAKQMLRLFKTKVPDGKENEDWMIYNYRGKDYYLNIPKTTTANIYKNEIRSSLKNKNRPYIPVIIQSIRVIDSNDSLNE